jgi:hypothetical protein
VFAGPGRHPVRGREGFTVPVNRPGFGLHNCRHAICVIEQLEAEGSMDDDCIDSEASPNDEDTCHLGIEPFGTASMFSRPNVNAPIMDVSTLPPAVVDVSGYVDEPPILTTQLFHSLSASLLAKLVRKTTIKA